MNPPLTLNRRPPPSLSSPSPRSAISGACPVRIPTSPSYAGATTESASPSNKTASGEITDTLSTCLLGKLLSAFDHAVDPTLHEERLLGILIEFAGDKSLERRDRLL